MRSRRTTVGAAVSSAVGLILLAVGCSGTASAVKPASSAQDTGTAKPVVLSLATPMGASDEFRAFLQNVRTLSHDEIQISAEFNAHHEEGPDFEEQLLLDVQSGRVDLAALGSRVFDIRRAPALGALTAPLLINSFDAEERVLGAPVAERMIREVDGGGLTGVGLLPGSLRRPFGAGTPLLGPEDYKGRTIGIQESKVADSTVRALGANPQWFGAGSSVAGFGGFEQQLVSVNGSRYDEAGMIGTANVVLWPRPIVLVANTKAFGRLSEDQRLLLRKAARQAVRGAGAELREQEHSALESLCARGQKFAAATPAQLTALRKAVQPVYDQLSRDRRTKEYLDAITALVRDVPAEPPLSCKG
ncbi:C4-dicarboxylate-binding periplasmic protein DctP [Streptomyces griseorubiginosus]|uniref:C4-dicarboxylate-binding periplasmic protein DctP n=1 Tax=Streptomyces griseorubiginosus TaxID=67304 RepID=A0AAI8KSL8_9ACTN|nr:C4-dicarboxylate-binding periplasmic protein DctP [Streptomyces griseorubiginosus]